MGRIKIIQPGLFTTIQDKGRMHYQKFGMPTAGAMDEFSMRVGNLLVGNKEFEACFEITMFGPQILFYEEALIAITGGNLGPKINNKPIRMWNSIKISKGDVLSFAGVQSGCRCYITIFGGIDVQEIMGSKSTYVRGGIGGFKGRALRKDDILEFKHMHIEEISINKSVPINEIPNYSNSYDIRVILGPQEDYFTEEAIELFLNSEYVVKNEADRMGYRLSGPKIQHSKGADIISDGIVLGSIQVPGQGFPIIMMADRQTTGGYPKIATVISSDIPTLAQVKPGDKIKFKEVTIFEAYEVLFEYKNKLERIKKAILEMESQISKSKKYIMKVNGKVYEVMIEEIV